MMHGVLNDLATQSEKGIHKNTLTYFLNYYATQVAWYYRIIVMQHTLPHQK
jgi:hypothetical protein